MATRTRGLDRRARRAIAVAVALLLAGPVILTARLVINKLNPPEQVAHPEEDQLVLLKDGSTMLVPHGSTGRIIANWLQEESATGVKTIDVGNENFAPESATLTNDGWAHLAQFSQLLKAHHEVNAVILYSAYHGIPKTEQLEHMRADKIHDEALHQGVGEDQIKVEREGYAAGHNAAADAGLEVVLTNRAD